MRAMGLTLVEILVALTVLAIGAAGLVGLQLLTLRLASATELRARLLHVAQSELRFRLLGAGSGSDCQSLPAAELEDVDCLVQSESCAYSQLGFSCPAAAGAWPRRITVSVRGSGDSLVTLSAVMRQTATAP